MPFQPGEILFGKYRIEVLIGQGAFAEVYRATHLSLDAPRALKLLRRNTPGIGSTDYHEFQGRFQLEAQLGDRLDHPNLIRVYDFEQADELSVLVMEYAPGGSLDKRIKQSRDQVQPNPVDEVIQVGLDVAKGLGALHALDVVHRDLKPSNILFDVKGHAKVADLGLAQVPGGPSMRSKLSQPLPHPGTAGYMSPEQEQGVPLLRPASDVYALGIVLFELLTGRNYALLKPGTHAASLRENVPVWLDELLTRMLAEDPKVRPWNGEEAAGLLLAGMEAEQALQVVAQKTWQDEQARQARNAEEKTVREAEERLREAERERQERQNAEQRRLQAEAEAKQKKLQQKSQPKRKFPVWAFFLIVLAGITGIVSLLPKQPSPSQTAVPTAVVRTPVIPATAMSAISAPSTVVPTFTLVPTLGIGSTWPRSADRMVMVYVPEGNFIMGSNDETIDAKPQHTVYLDAYWIDKTDVTNSMFEIFINQTGYQTDAEKSRSSYVFNTVTDKWESTLDANWKHPQGSNSSLANLNEHPVVQVSWNDAQAYCKWADARLPTEAEWEKAARGTDGRKYPWGNQAPTGDLSNFADVNLVVSWADKTNNDGYEFTSPVGSYPAGASPYGALDMAGNVSQWVNDWWDPNYYANSPSSNPQGPSSGTQRLKPGGSWYDGQLSIQSAFRPFDVPGWTDESSGFRCARS